MKNAHLVYKLSRRNTVGMLKMAVQNTLQVIEIVFLHYERKDIDQSPLEMMIQLKSLEKAQS
jgi:predicted transcriptional regulator